MEREFVGSSLFLFVDNVLLSITGWLFWIIMGKFISPSNLGLSTYLFTLAAFVSGILLLGLEFSLLKVVNPKNIVLDDASKKRLRVSTFSVIVAFELVVNLLIIPFLWILLANINRGLDLPFLISTVLILLFTTIGTVSRYGLLGILSTKNVLLIDLLSTIGRLATAIIMIYLNDRDFAIIFATVLQTLILAVFLTFIFISKMGLHVGDISLLKKILKEGVSNFPGKISKMMIAPLSIILLGLMGMNSFAIGVFFIALIITVAAASFATSIATISLTSSYQNIKVTDLSFRIGLSMTAPIIAVLVCFPKLILGLISPSYTQGYFVLIVLSLSILPSITVFNLITRLNSNNDNRKLIIVGVVELVSLIVLFYILVPIYHSIGAAFAIFISYILSSIIGSRWLLKREIAQLLRILVSLTIGIAVGLLFQKLASDVVLLCISPIAVILTNHITGALRLQEIISFLKLIRGASYSSA